MSERENRPVALLRDALRRLLRIDAQRSSENIIQAIVDVFFEGGFYISYDPATGHLAFAPTPKLVAEMQSSDANQPSKNKKLS